MVDLNKTVIKWTPDCGLTIEEVDELNKQRICNLVGDRDGEKTNPDGEAHPFNQYYICHKNVHNADAQRMERCNYVAVSVSTAAQHQVDAHGFKGTA